MSRERNDAFYPKIETDTNSLSNLFEQSKRNLDSYWIKISDVFPRIKNAYNLKADNVYDLEFYNFLKEYQRVNNIPSNWVLDINTISKMNEQIPSLFSFHVKNSIDAYKNWFISWRQELSLGTWKEISDLEANLVSDNIWIPKNQAFNVAQKSIPLSWNVENMQNSIIKFQEEQLINPKDWRISKRTYIEIELRETYNSDKIAEMLTNKTITPKDKDIILNAFKEWNINTKQWIALSVFLKEFEDQNKNNPNFEKEYWEFFRLIKNYLQDYQNTAEGKINFDNSQKNSQSVYAMLKDESISNWEKVERILKDPVLLLTAWALFLFGSFWTWTKFTDRWWKRLWVILAWVAFWPNVIKHFWIDEAINDLKGKINETSQTTSNAVDATKPVREQARESTRTFIEQAPAWVSWKVNDAYTTTKDYANDALNYINWTLSELSSKNEAYRNSKNEAEKALYVKNFDLFAKEITNDNKFQNLKIEDLEKSKWDVSKIKPLLSEETRKRIFPDNLSAEQRQERNKDLVNYINLLLSSKKENNVFVSDIIVSNSFLENIRDSLTENYKYFDDENLNSEVKNIILKLSDKERNSIAQELSKFFEEKNGQRANYLSNLLKRIDLSYEDRKIIGQLENIYIVKHVYDDFSEKISKIDILLWNDSLLKLKEYRNNANQKISWNNLHKTNPKIADIFIIKISSSYSQKELEILKTIQNKDSNQTERLSILEDNLIFTESLLKVWSLPTFLDASSYNSYLTKDRMVSYEKLISVYNKYYEKNKNNLASLGLKEENWVISKLNTNLNIDDNKVIIREIIFNWNQAKNNFEKVKSQIIWFMDSDIRVINNLINEIKDTTKTDENFQARYSEYSSRMNEIFSRLYPNNLPKGIIDFNWWILYISNNKWEFIYSTLLNNIKIVENNNSSLENKKVELLNALNSLKLWLESRNKNTSESILDWKMKELLTSKPEIFWVYKSFYEKLPDDLKKQVPNPSKTEEISNIRIDWLKSILISLWNNIKQSSINIDSFNNEYEELNRILSLYLSQ